MLHGKEKMLPRVSSIEICRDYVMVVTFQNGKRRLYDAGPMKNLLMFDSASSLARFEYGNIFWPKDIGIAAHSSQLPKPRYKCLPRDWTIQF